MNSNKKIIFVGDVALDEYYEAQYYPRLSEKISVETLSSHPGGMIANAACVYAGYHGAIDFCAVLNSGHVSQYLCKDLNDNNVKTTMVMKDETLPDSKVIIILAQDEHTCFIPSLHIKNIPLNENAYQNIINAEMVYSNIHEIKFLSYREKNAHDIISEAKSRGCRFAFDLDIADFREGEREYIKYIDYLFVNDIGFKNLKSELKLDEDIHKLFGEGVKLVIHTMGSKGVEVYSHDGVEKTCVEGVSVPVVDVTGAGDTFSSSFMFAFRKLNDVKKAATFATYAAARSVRILGARSGVSNVEEVLEFMRERSIDIIQYKELKRRR
ncbi:MAG: carbohydrate kinase family protein [Breznakia sp.]